MDGASVMLSQQNGVAGLHQRNVPFCVALHCVCHRMHLAICKAANSIQNVKTLQTIVSTIYQHINNSPNRLHKFKEMAKLLAMAEDGNVVGEEEEGLPTYASLKFKKVIWKKYFAQN